MIAADLVLVASGTASLEAALLKRPMVITYKLAPASFHRMWRRKYLPYVGLPNIISREFIVPEILQDEATAENLSQALLNLLEDAGIQACLQQRFYDMHLSLKQDTSERVVQAILPYLPRGNR